LTRAALELHVDWEKLGKVSPWRASAAIAFAYRIRLARPETTLAGIPHLWHARGDGSDRSRVSTMNGRRSVILALAVFGALMSSALAIAAGGNAASGISISSVVLHGSVAAPLIEIRGHGFGTRPPASPPRPPVPPFASRDLQGGSGCTATPAPGLDYGAQLYYASSKLSAGRYRPTLQPVHELDCVGLVILAYSPSRILVRIGSDYRTHHYTLPEGDHFEVAVKSARFHGVAHYLP
jgi:hypothetical protein